MNTVDEYEVTNQYKTKRMLIVLNEILRCDEYALSFADVARLECRLIGRFHLTKVVFYFYC